MRPEIVGAAWQFHHRSGTEIALVHLAIVSDSFYDSGSPSIVESDQLSVAAVDAEQTPDHFIVALLHLLQVRLRYYALLHVKLRSSPSCSKPGVLGIKILLDRKP